jgi:hypothetical protein
VILVTSSLDQQMEALKYANEVRIRRSHLKDTLRTSPAPVAAVSRIVIEPPDWAEGMNVEQLLRAMPGWGVARVKRAMRSCLLRDLKPIGGLSARQRELLCEAIASHHPNRGR